MGIVFNKRGGVGMGATRPEPAPLPFLIQPNSTFIYFFFLFGKYKASIHTLGNTKLLFTHCSPTENTDYIVTLQYFFSR